MTSCSDVPTEDLSDAPKIDTSATSASPTISAAAVTVVRFGFRIALPRASTPVTPNIKGSGRPTKAASRRATSGPRTTMPTKITNPPRNVTATDCSSGSGPRIPYAPTAIPIPVTIVPVIARDTVERRRLVMRRSPIAAIGGVRAARIAGTIAASNVTPTPTTAHASMVRFSTTNARSGTGTPTPGRSQSNSLPSPTPSANPAPDATSPMISASISTDPTTCPPDAPIARRSPNSRVRWATRIVNVLKMMNPPTSSPMPANPSSRSLISDRKSST